MDEPGLNTPDIFVKPSIILATLSPNSFSIKSKVISVSSTTSCNSAAIIEVVPNPISSTQICATLIGCKI